MYFELASRPCGQELRSHFPSSSNEYANDSSDLHVLQIVKQSLSKKPPSASGLPVEPVNIVVITGDQEEQIDRYQTALNSCSGVFINMTLSVSFLALVYIAANALSFFSN